MQIIHNIQRLLTVMLGLGLGQIQRPWPWPWKYEALALALECEALALHANALLTMYCRSNYLHACRMMHLIVSMKYR